MTRPMTEREVLVFNRAMKTSYYYPIASYNEPRLFRPSDAIEPSPTTNFYTEYFSSFSSYEIEDMSTLNIYANDLSDFIKRVESTIKRLSDSDRVLFDDMIEDAFRYFDEEQSCLEQNNMTLEEALSFLQSTKTVSQLLRYRHYQQRSIAA
jgi:hypothetical protein